jgi:NAD(P)-dependent dehydrogenase (short-subunit alcohol dehydrogenase family)
MGQIGLTETLAVDVGEYNIRVNAVSPGPIQRERIFNVVEKRIEATGASFDSIMKELASNTAGPRRGANLLATGTWIMTNSEERL